MKQKKEEIAVIYAYARTGATLLNKLLGCTEENWVLSEISPSVSVMPPVEQAKHWFGYSGKETPDSPYVKQLLDIQKYAQEQDKNLVVRDWSYIDFGGFPWITPIYKSSQRAELLLYFDLKEIAVVRHPQDVFNSVNKKTSVRGLLNFQAFIKSYDEYTKFAKDVGFVRYEDLCVATVKTLKTVTNTLNIAYPKGYKNKWASFDKYSGDFSKATQIVLDVPKRQTVTNPTYNRILERLGYE